MNTLNQLAALKDGRIDAGIGRLTFDDPVIGRHVIEHERLIAAVPANHPLACGEGPLALAELAGETLILYPSEPRPSYADQVLDILRDNGLRPQTVRTVRELQTALGLVSAEAGVAIVPASIRRLRRDDVSYRDIAECGAVSPIILNWRCADSTGPLAVLLRLCREMSGDAKVTVNEPVRPTD